MGETIPIDALRSARKAGLTYVSDSAPGIARKRRGTSFFYLDAKHRTVRDPKLIARIRSLVIPPAWTEVWICPRADGHIQATGRDARGRKQYRYHAKWREHRDASKYHQLVDFGRALCRVRARVEADLARRELCLEKVVAAIVRLLERTLIRVGNDEYARANRSYGLTTLRDDHVDIAGSALAFDFRGKSGIERRLTIKDPQLARVVRRCSDLPGHTLFQYVDATGKPRRVGSSDVNRYLREASGLDFTAKSYRTWGGTLEVMCMLGNEAPPASEREAKSTVLRAIEAAAQHLGNTRAVCRKYYVHPAIIEAYEEGTLSTLTGKIASVASRARVGLSPQEKVLCALLAKRARKPPRVAAEALGRAV